MQDFLLFIHQNIVSVKIQDMVFFVVFVGLLFQKKPKQAVYAGVVCLLLSIPLFSMWKFFTAERLTWYAAAFFLLFTVQVYLRLKKE